MDDDDDGDDDKDLHMTKSYEAYKSPKAHIRYAPEEVGNCYQTYCDVASYIILSTINSLDHNIYTVFRHPDNSPTVHP